MAAALGRRGLRPVCVDLGAGAPAVGMLEKLLRRRGGYLAGVACPKGAFGVERLCAVIRKLSPRSEIVLGGYEAAVFPERLLKGAGALCAVTGEGEVTFPELAECVNRGGGLEGVRGIAFFRDGRLVRTLPAERVKDLDSLPEPALDRFFPLLKNAWKASGGIPGLLLITSRGCGGGLCEGCPAHDIQGGRTRYHSAEYVLGMIRRYHRNHGVKFFVFGDARFAGDKKRLEKICGGISSLSKSIRWCCTLAPEDASRETLEILKDSGCEEITFCFAKRPLRGLEKIRALIEKFRLPARVIIASGKVVKLGGG